jgi:hypothetical protein
VTVRVYLTAAKGSPPGTKPKALKALEVPLEGHHEHTDVVARAVRAAVAKLVGVVETKVLVNRAHPSGFVAYAPPP